MSFWEGLTDELVWEARLKGNEEGATGGLWQRTFMAEKGRRILNVNDLEVWTELNGFIMLIIIWSLVDFTTI